MGPILFTAQVNVPTHFWGSEFVPWRPQEPRTRLPTERDHISMGRSRGEWWVPRGRSLSIATSMVVNVASEDRRSPLRQGAELPIKQQRRQQNKRHDPAASTTAGR